MVFSTLKLVSLSALFFAGYAVEQIPIWNKSDPKYIGESLAPQKYLKTGDFLMSENCMFQFILEADGGLRLYKNIGGQRASIWSAGTSGSAAYRELWFQADNNLVLYEYNEPHTSRKAVWASGRDDSPFVFPVTLVMQNDGNLVHYVDNLTGNSYKADWHTNTWSEGIGSTNACFICHSIKIESMTVEEPIDEPESVNVFQSFYDNCGNDKQEITQVITHSKTVSTKEHYSFTESFSETYSNTVKETFGLSFSFGVVLDFLSLGMSASASVEETTSITETRSSTSVEDLTTEEVLFYSNEYTIPLTIPANKQVTHYVTELWGNAKVEWNGVGVCYDKNMEKIESKPVSGVFHSSKYSRRVSTCDFCDNAYTPQDTGCLEADDGARRLLESSSK